MLCSRVVSADGLSVVVRTDRLNPMPQVRYGSEPAGGSSFQEESAMPDYRQGRIEVVAGTGVAGDQGDGGPARLAELFLPVALCLDAEGHLFISDYNSFSIRRVDAASQVITTVAGGMSEPDAWGGDFDPCEQALPDGQPAIWAALEASDLVVRGSRLYLALPEENRIRYVDFKTGRLFTLVGTGQAGCDGDGGPALTGELNEPNGICFDPAGNLYVADAENDRIRRVESASGLLHTVAGGGAQPICHVEEPIAALEAELIHPRCLLVLPDGTLVVGSENGVFRLDLVAGLIAPLVAGSGACEELSLGVDAMACDPQGNLFFTSSVQQVIWMLAPGGRELVRVVGSGCLGTECPEAGTAGAIDLASPRGLAVSNAGVLYFSDAGIYQAFRVVFD
jgi:sugar lactone lactonase YvrE